MRLTEKGIRRHNLTWPSSEKVLINREEEMNQYNKLADLEDIEEKLGVDLLELLSNGDFQHLIYCFTNKIPFLFAPKKEGDE